MASSNEKVSFAEVMATFGSGFVIAGDDYSGLDWQNTDITKPTEAEVNAKQVEMQKALDDLAYSRARQAEYPSSGDQMDMIYKDNKNSTTTHADAVEAVKTKWPKDNSGPV